MFPPDDASVLVAGASSGIGRAVATNLARTGRRVVLFARRAHLLKEIVEQIQSFGGVADVCEGDATTPADAAQAVELAASTGNLVALVNCVGTNIPRRSLSELSHAAWSRMVVSNLDAAFVLTQAVLPTLRRQRHGLLVHIASRAVHQPDASGVAYQATKAGVAALAHATMIEEQSNGIRVSVVYPGMTNTPLLYQRPAPPTDSDLARALDPDDVAQVVQVLVELPDRAYIPDVSIYPSR